MTAPVEATPAGFRRWLLDTALPLWWAVGADHVRGGFFEAIAMDGRPVEAPRRVRVQARQTYVYATAGALGWDGPWREAMDHGLDYLLSRYRRDDGLFRARVTADGRPDDETALIYDQAFVLFALASVLKAEPGHAGHLTPLARRLHDRVLAHFRHDGAGLREANDAQPFQSNPHMHLLEAALAWGEVDDDPAWRDLTLRLAELCLARFIDAQSGALREFFGPDWRPAAGLDGRLVWPGHQFEWAWLLRRWAGLTGREDAAAAADRLQHVGSAHGVDRGRGVAVFALLDDLSLHEPMARLWAQTEWIKATVGDAADVRAAMSGLAAYLDTPTPGLWRDWMTASGGFVEEPAPASSFYHIACAIAELQRAAPDAEPR